MTNPQQQQQQQQQHDMRKEGQVDNKNYNTDQSIRCHWYDITNTIPIKID
jgi:hypothetical protein